ncbi:MAG: ChaN family lipoprotein [Bdellovibrionaceae bacterium]|nr:ChaN family lipoprotein [Pseudobdellovibrionaceae bacterium]
MLIRTFIGFGLLFSLSQAVFALPNRGIVRGEDGQAVSLAYVAEAVPRGGILVIGENHGLAVHRDQHLALLKQLRTAGHKVSVGLEFINYPFQPFVDGWRAGQLTEEEFLQKIGWGGTPFEFYRPQAQFPLLSEGAKTLALNAPRSVTSKIAKEGLESLSADERRLLPGDFQLGRDPYRRRFEAMMPHLPDGPAKDRYFAAQSAWDDTMAWTALKFMRANPEQTLVIIVGDFHVQYGGGLPDRLRSRSNIPVRTLSQLDSSGLSPEEIEAEVLPTDADGIRADWIWVDESRVPTPQP